MEAGEKDGLTCDSRVHIRDISLSELTRMQTEAGAQISAAAGTESAPEVACKRCVCFFSFACVCVCA